MAPRAHEPGGFIKRVQTRRRTVYLLPNLFTSGSLFCALYSVVMAADGDYRKACYLILLSAVFDALDGPVARLTRSASSFGLQYDSLADVVAFGVAPAFLMHRKLSTIQGTVDLSQWAPNLALGACALFVICGAIRLARFNVQVSTEERRYFTGLPIPAAAGVVVSAFLFVETYMTDTKNLHRLILLLMVAMAGLMVSTIPFPKLEFMIRRAQNNANMLVATVFIACLVVILWAHLPTILLASSVIYIGFSIIAHIRRGGAQPAPAGASSAAVPRIAGNE
jgi:CDP-diacylglycerol--serine O-phosphatidyltransferase